MNILPLAPPYSDHVRLAHNLCMFTGIVEQLGSVKEISAQRLRILAIEDPNDPCQSGESVAVNGCCLTVVESNPDLLFEMSEETLARTSLKNLKHGAKVNLERAMKASGRFGGHIVQGHVDATGQLLRTEETNQAHVLTFSYPKGYGRYIIPKGSVTVDGISLTVVDPTASEFTVWIIPHTWENTNLSTLRKGDEVNLEFDVLAKYVERLLGDK